MNKPLFPQINGLIYGGDYNPDQWLDRPDILERDIALMKEAGVNCVTLGVFAWSAYEPEEGHFTFDWLKERMDTLYENGIYTILSTPSGARPAWLDRKYPDAMRCDAMGVRNHHGQRENHCMSSENYRKKVEIIDTELAKRFADHPGLLMWHISNEFGGDCYCDSCCRRFREYLKNRYGTIEALNKAWWTGFWSHHFNSFDEIDPPYANGECCVLGQNLDWRRFTTEIYTEFMRVEIDAVHRYRPEVPVTTNFMWFYGGIDYHRMAQELDATSWDAYPELGNDYESREETFRKVAFNHTLFRSMKPDRPFMLMESAPGATNWQKINKERRPGMIRLTGLQAIACGSDTVQYFQIRKGRGSSEQHHAALIDHKGTDDTRLFREAAEVGQMLRSLAEVQGSVVSCRAAVLMDWDNRWAVQDARTLAKDEKKYDETVMQLWEQLQRQGIDADIISSDTDLSRYSLLIAPMYYLLHDGIGEKLSAFVERGGILIGTYFTGWVDSSTLAYLGGFPGQELSRLFGISAEETDALYPSDRNTIRCTESGRTYEVRDIQELLRVITADTRAVYAGDYIEGMPAVTRNAFGKGAAWYVSCRLAPSDMAELFAKAAAEAGIEPEREFPGVEHHVRRGDGVRYDFYFNAEGTPTDITVPEGVDLLTGKAVGGTVHLGDTDALVIRRAD